MAAEDIVSDSLIKLWEKMRTEIVDPAGPYLFTILKNLSLDYLRHQSIKKDVHHTITDRLNRELAIRINALEDSDPNEIFSQEIIQIIEATLNCLPEKTREIFIMSRFDNKQHREIADFYKISVKGVDYHLAKAVSDLRHALKDYLPLISIFPFLKL
jgi:RNA polymerase sigma-70 factor (ECF subfamily)